MNPQKFFIFSIMAPIRSYFGCLKLAKFTKVRHRTFLFFDDKGATVKLLKVYHYFYLRKVHL